jgi:hypothetical protein
MSTSKYTGGSAPIYRVYGPLLTLALDGRTMMMNTSLALTFLAASLRYNV